MRGALAILVAFHHEKDAGKKFQNICCVRGAFCLRLRSLVNGDRDCIPDEAAPRQNFEVAPGSGTVAPRPEQGYAQHEGHNHACDSARNRISIDPGVHRYHTREPEHAEYAANQGPDYHRGPSEDGQR
jgi:hypothetical protein